MPDLAVARGKACSTCSTCTPTTSRLLYAQPGRSSSHILSRAGLPQVATSVNLSDSDTVQFLNSVSALRFPEARCDARGARVPLVPHAIGGELQSWCLREGNVAKVVKEAIVEMSFMPSTRSGKCVIAACDKRGQVRPCSRLAAGKLYCAPVACRCGHRANHVCASWSGLQMAETLQCCRCHVHASCCSSSHVRATATVSQPSAWLQRLLHRGGGSF